MAQAWLGRKRAVGRDSWASAGAPARKARRNDETRQRNDAEDAGRRAGTLDKLPEGPFRAPAPHKVRPPKGDYYFAVESARGALGYYIVSDGTPYPYRLKARVPSYGNLQVLTDVLPGTLVADTISILGSIDIVVPEVDR